MKNVILFSIVILLTSTLSAMESENNENSQIIQKLKKGLQELCKTDLSKNNFDWFNGINAQNKDGNTMLIFATMWKMKKMVELLIKYNADVNIKNNLGRTALMYAISNENEEISKILIENHANVNGKDNEGGTPLMMATFAGHKEIVKLLIENEADINDKFAKNMSILMIAAFCGFKEIVELLLQNGAAIDEIDENGKTAIQYATEKGHNEIVKLLNAYKIFKIKTSLKTVLRKVNIKGICENNIPFFEDFEDVNSKSKKSENICGGLTFLMLAIRLGQKDIIEELIKMGANANAQNEYGYTALMFAAHHYIPNQEEIIKLLIENGADINLKSNKRKTAAQIAFERGFYKIGWLLIQNGAVIENKDYYGKYECSIQ